MLAASARFFYSCVNKDVTNASAAAAAHIASRRRILPCAAHNDAHLMQCASSSCAHVRFVSLQREHTKRISCDHGLGGLVGRDKKINEANSCANIWCTYREPPSCPHFLFCSTLVCGNCVDADVSINYFTHSTSHNDVMMKQTQSTERQTPALLSRKR